MAKMANRPSVIPAPHLACVVHGTGKRPKSHVSYELRRQGLVTTDVLQFGGAGPLLRSLGRQVARHVFGIGRRHAHLDPFGRQIQRPFPPSMQLRITQEVREFHFSSAWFPRQACHESAVADREPTPEELLLKRHLLKIVWDGQLQRYGFLGYGFLGGGIRCCTNIGAFCWIFDEQRLGDRQLSGGWLNVNEVILDSQGTRGCDGVSCRERNSGGRVLVGQCQGRTGIVDALVVGRRFVRDVRTDQQVTKQNRPDASVVV